MMRLIESVTFWRRLCFHVHTHGHALGSRRWLTTSAVFKGRHSAKYRGTPPAAGVSDQLATSARDQERHVEAFGGLSESGMLLREDIWYGRVDAVAHLRESQPQNEDSLETVRVCLEATFSRIMQPELSGLLLAEVEQAQKNGLARAVLTHIWTDDQMAGKLAQLDHMSTYRLCHFALAEGLRSYLVDWMTLEKPVFADPRSDSAWRSTLFTELLKAIAERESQSNADAAISQFFEVIRMKERARALTDATGRQPTPVERIPTFTSALVLQRTLTSRSRSNTNPVLYDRFVKFWERSPQLQNAREYALALACLQLRHPHDPRPDLFLALLRSLIGRDGFVDDQQLPSKITVRSDKLQSLLNVAERLLKESGNTKDREWLRNMKRLFMQANATNGSRLVIKRFFI